MKISNIAPLSTRNQMSYLDHVTKLTGSRTKAQAVVHESKTFNFHTVVKDMPSDGKMKYKFTCLGCDKEFGANSKNKKRCFDCRVAANKARMARLKKKK